MKIGTHFWWEPLCIRHRTYIYIRLQRFKLVQSIYLLCWNLKLAVPCLNVKCSVIVFRWNICFPSKELEFRIPKTVTSFGLWRYDEKRCSNIENDLRKQQCTGKFSRE